MPINIPDNIPAASVLAAENIFVLNQKRAVHQDIRPLKIAILNLMPLKQQTEIHLLRLLANSPLQVEIDLVRTASYQPKNTPDDHLRVFYKTFDEIKHHKYDGMIFTGAPVEHFSFKEVKYWDEMAMFMDWARDHVTSTLFICWAAQAGLFHHFGIQKYPLGKKLFGVYEHVILDPKNPLVRGFDDVFNVPHSRYTEIRAEEIQSVGELEIISASDKAGIYIVISKDHRNIFITGHSEYDALTLGDEYNRDISKGLNIQIPENYFPDNDPNRSPQVKWRSHASLLFINWLNYFVYQETPYDLNKINNQKIYNYEDCNCWGYRPRG
jgi:homoserine O-succinyltransferase/O-acetyltransferase